jgi:hypothetical protein
MSLKFEDFDEIDQFLKQHFENITPEEFKSNLKDACPDFFDDSNQLTYDDKAITNSMEIPLLVDDNNDYQEIDRILKEHFEKVTPEEFRRNLAIACPDLFEDLTPVIFDDRYVDLSNRSEHKTPNLPRYYAVSAAIGLVILVIAFTGRIETDHFLLEVIKSTLQLVKSVFR